MCYNCPSGRSVILSRHVQVLPPLAPRTGTDAEMQPTDLPVPLVNELVIGNPLLRKELLRELDEFINLPVTRLEVIQHI